MELKKHPWKQCEFELYKDNEPTGKIYILNDENNWCIEEWLDDEHEYEFREINIPRGYKPEYYRYRDDQINNIRVINNLMWTINLTCIFNDDNNSEGLQPTELSFRLKSGEATVDFDLNNEEWTEIIKTTSQININELQFSIINTINDTPQLLFYTHDIKQIVYEENFMIEIIYTFTFENGINNVFQNLMESVLDGYAKIEDKIGRAHV